MKEMVSIDPGVGGTGMVFWKGEKAVKVLTLRSGSSPDWAIKARTIMESFNQFMRLLGRVDRVVMEMPGYMAGVGGHMVAQSGDLVKLALLTGMIFEASHAFSSNVELVPVHEWKGQLPKDVCAERIFEIMGASFPKGQSNHAVDALGIGLWAQGRFK
jgi:hypothetical protein